MKLLNRVKLSSTERLADFLSQIRRSANLCIHPHPSDVNRYVAEIFVSMFIYLVLCVIYREQTIVSHHNRIEQLRESYAKKLEASEMTCRTVSLQ